MVFIGHNLVRVLGVKIFGGDFLGRLAFESCRAIGVEGGHLDRVMWGGVERLNKLCGVVWRD